jgi:hypothetical protein
VRNVNRAALLRAIEVAVIELAMEAPPSARKFAAQARDIIQILIEGEENMPVIVPLVVGVWLLTVPSGRRHDALRQMLDRAKQAFDTLHPAVRTALQMEDET